MKIGDFVELNSGNDKVNDLMVVDIEGSDCTVSWTNDDNIKEELTAPKACFKNATTS